MTWHNFIKIPNSIREPVTQPLKLYDKKRKKTKKNYVTRMEDYHLTKTFLFSKLVCSWQGSLERHEKDRKLLKKRSSSLVEYSINGHVGRQEDMMA